MMWVWCPFCSICDVWTLECTARSPASLLRPSCPLYQAHFLVLSPCWRKPTCVLMGRHSTALPSTDVTSQILPFQTCVPWGRFGLGQLWTELIGRTGSHKESWEGRAGGRHSPDPVGEVKKTREVERASRTCMRSKAGLGDLGPCPWQLLILLISNIPAV